MDCRSALPHELMAHSANGAKYDSQGQAPSEARRVAPGYQIRLQESTESAKYDRWLFRSFRASRVMTLYTRGDALSSAQRLPLAIIFRAVGAAPYSAPLALRRLNHDFYSPRTSLNPNSVVLVLAGTKSRKQEVIGVSGFVGSVT